ncbi:UxaA family hydrolase [Elongatibacter sediminis]|uniref:Altronate dehydratase family protein n=1 Tax=Elongatibacter sediminis TaxID=3119006 RepID=A0AAW9R6F4_9GAMM
MSEISSLIRLHPDDNVAIAVRALERGETFGEFAVVENIPALHKVAVRDIGAGERVLKYRQTIGLAEGEIRAGAHVHDHNCRVASLQRDYDPCGAARVTEIVPETGRAFFQGFRRANGKVGTRNFLGVITSVNCSGTVANQIAARLNASQAVAESDHIDGVVPLVHGTGCGMRAEGEGFETLRRTLRGYAAHPNFGGVLIVGLGCEAMQIEPMLAEYGLAESDTLRYLTIQDAGGTREAIERGLGLFGDMLPGVAGARRESVPASELTLALQCGGSDALSGVTANPALGAAVDLLVAQGGTAILSETPEIYGAEHLLVSRAREPAVAEALIERVRWWEDYTRRTGDELNNNPSPGNLKGGLTTILEKSLGAVAKGGSTDLCGVYRYAQPVDRKGLVFMDSPGFDPASVTGQVAAGANVICFTTGRGSAFGFKPVPSLKLASNSDIFRRMSEDMDLDCGDIVERGVDVQAKGREIFQAVLATASGRPTRSEELDYGLNEFTPWQIGAVL